MNLDMKIYSEVLNEGEFPTIMANVDGKIINTEITGSDISELRWYGVNIEKYIIDTILYKIDLKEK